MQNGERASANDDGSRKIAYSDEQPVAQVVDGLAIHGDGGDVGEEAAVVGEDGRRGADEDRVGGTPGAGASCEDHTC